MFAVDDTLISEDVAEARFACNLGACLGGCCVVGDQGAPLEADERQRLEAALPVVRPMLRPEALRVIDRDGVWEEVGDDQWATTCVDDRECVFVVFDGPVAKCALQKAYRAGRLDFEKPLSCHLYPLRFERYGTYEVMNYEPIALCAAAEGLGRRQGVWLSDFLREPLVRKYGEAWYERFQEACRERRELMQPAGGGPHA